LLEAVEGLEHRGGVVSELVADEPRRERMGEAARELAVERYSWPTIARRLERIYEGVTRVGRDEARAA